MHQKYLRELELILQEREAAAPISIREVMKTLSDKPIVLYGAGAFGSENLALFRKYGVNPVAFLDQKAEPGSLKEGIPVYHPDDAALSPAFRENCTIYISITIPKRIMAAIKESLFEWGYSDCRVVQSVTARQIQFEHNSDENPGNDYVTMHKEQILHALTLMSDEESCKTYVSSIRAHLLRDYENCVETDFPVQYFNAGVPLKRGFSSFVDCGAYNGDSLKSILQYCDHLETYVGFEPIVPNFSALSYEADQLGTAVKRAYLFPCGVAEQTGSARFTIAASSSSMTDSGSGEVLPLVRIDDVIKRVPVTFLKMDIEGAELSALRGASTLIMTQAPDLAISVYHYANHYWEIPCLIESMNSGYRFFLRAHTPATLETVLYCIEG
ncbi:FkbM family methyltransferase [Anaerospora hongkongensis]|uniref:FkbM family methyltransferase n=1 Tax=Anaerospora hongkongensis TaxID=244830 RepID=A0A4R1PVB8_9FIRM|nr:FkbM family methyltransferase [Anaerospora hongkongensis]TCL36130.1 FkbM family methyltransferase [Anaerospora hongkongensis]